MNDILVIIVIYNKKVSELKYLKELKEVDILIYDNSVDEQNIKGIHYYHDKDNPGVSKAYNYGIDLAKKLNKKYVLLLDQDTKFDYCVFSKYIEMKEKYNEEYLYSSIIIGKDRIYSPCIEKKYRNVWQSLNKFSYEEIYNIENKSLINTAIMIPIKIIDKIGGFNENIKLDFSDAYFIEKYKSLKKEIVLVNVKINHSISGDEGKSKKKEIDRFKYYCNGGKEFKKNYSYNRIDRLIIFRMIRLVLKYKTIIPIKIFREYYLGDLVV